MRKLNFFLRNCEYCISLVDSFSNCIGNAQGLVVSSGKVQRYYGKERIISTELFYVTFLSPPAFSGAYLTAFKTCSLK